MVTCNLYKFFEILGGDVEKDKITVARMDARGNRYGEPICLSFTDFRATKGAVELQEAVEHANKTHNNQWR